MAGTAFWKSRGFIILISLGFNIHQADRSNVLHDNDIKYRYVKMQDKVSPEEPYRLENVFTLDRSKGIVKIVRKQVELYERLVKEQAEQARLNAEEAQKLNDRAKPPLFIQRSYFP